MAGTMIAPSGTTSHMTGSAETLIVMPAGDSITKGSGTAASWRKEFWRRNRLRRGNIRMLGGQVLGDLAAFVLGDWRHEGHAGASMDALAAAFAGYIAASGQPVAIVEMSGSNDFGTSTAACVTAKRAYLTAIRAASPYAYVFVCSAPRLFSPAENYAASTVVRDAFTALLPSIVADYPGMEFCDVCSGLTADDMQSDGTHPNETGSAKIGAGIETYVHRRFPLDAGIIMPAALTSRGAQASVKLVTTSADAITITNTAAEMTSGRLLVRFMLRPASLPASFVALAQYQQPYTAGFLLGYDGSVSTPTLNAYFGASAAINYQCSLAAGTWADVAVYGDPTTGIVQVYVNGVLNGYGTVDPWTPTAGGSWKFGKNASFSGITGDIDNIAIHTGTALPAPEDARAVVEAAYLYNSTIPGRKALYRSDENTGTSLADADGGAAGSMGGSGITWETTVHPWD